MASRVFTKNFMKTFSMFSTSFRPVSTSKARLAIFNESGGVLSKPEKVSFGLTRLVLVVVPFVLIGAKISETGAAWLEENEIFVPDEDDD